jgi:hypothetical protein
MKKKGIYLVGVLIVAVVVFRNCGSSDTPKDSLKEKEQIMEEESRYAEDIDEDEEEVVEERKEKKEKKKKEKKKEEKKEKKKKSSGVSDDFKKTLDEYEKYIDEYVEFMKDYNNNPSDLELLEDYGTMMEQYQKVADGMDELDNRDMTPEEEKYFIRVQERINKKLLEVSATLE